MKITISNKLILVNLPEDFQAVLCEKLTLVNPKWHENERMNRSNYKTSRLLRFYERIQCGLILPRGYCGHLIRLCWQYNVKYSLDDRRRSLSEVEFSFHGKLKPFQANATNDILKKDFGTLSAPTGSGKTVMALAIIAQRKQPALIVVHTKELLNQWCDRIETFLGIPREEIGIIGNGKKNIGERVTVALVQSLYKCTKDISPHIGCLVIDECHRAPSRTFTEATTVFDSKFMLGLSATPYRRDKLSRLIFWHLGDIHHQVDKEHLIKNGDILKPEVITKETDFTTRLDASVDYSKVLSELTKDRQRNELIISDVVREVRRITGICLVLSDRKEHCHSIQAILQGQNITSEILTGDVPTKQRQEITDSLNTGKIKILIATGQLIGEGFDCKKLSSLFLATPIKFSGRLLQYVGRILRPAPGKHRARIFDYIDVKVPVLKASAQARKKAYAYNQ